MNRVSNMYDQNKIKYHTNITNCDEDLQRFTGMEDMQAFCRKYQTSGFEYMDVMRHKCADIPAQLIGGVHMLCHDCFVDFWRGNKKALLEEFDSEENIIREYGGLTKESFLARMREDLDLARACNASYVVFHVSEIRITEVFGRKFHYRDEEVIDSACELINELLDGQEYPFDFLMENLWWPGFRFDRPEITRRLLEGVHYQKKGIMLDTGHLLHTNPELHTQEEGIAYIKKCLQEHGNLVQYIKGIHLQQSLTGEVMRRIRAEEVSLGMSYEERWKNVFPYIFQMDEHQAFSVPEVQTLLEAVRPVYVTHEFISSSREEQEQMLDRQCGALKAGR